MTPLSNRAYVFVKLGYGKPRLFTSIKAATSYALSMIYCYDTPQGADAADYIGNTIIKQLEQGYNVIDIAYGLHTYASNKDIKQLADTMNAYVTRTR